jgi:hypothetical protein
MNMPGFCAEASLNKTSGRYRLAAGMAGMATMHISLAQFVRPLPDGDGQTCTPGQTLCFFDTDSPTGCSQCFINRQCEEVGCRPCTGCRPPCTCTTTRCCDGNCSTSAPVSC